MSIKTLEIAGMNYVLLSEGDNGQVIVYKENVAKVFELGSIAAKEEYAAMKFANSVNKLVVNAIELKPSEDYKYDLLIMERVYPLQYRAINIESRQEMFAQFEKQLKELHKAGFAHWDIQRPTSFQKGAIWDNIILTPQGLRLIDTGNSIYPGHINQDELEDAIEDDIACLNNFKSVFLTL